MLSPSAVYLTESSPMKQVRTDNANVPLHQIVPCSASARLAGSMADKVVACVNHQSCKLVDPADHSRSHKRTLAHKHSMAEGQCGINSLSVLGGRIEQVNRQRDVKPLDPPFWCH
jgi:predicted RNA-binding Zn ribbon-like protein